jgi:PadR family transcriptional regulator, regulatory protein PadR
MIPISRMARHTESKSRDAELLQGTLDMLILKVTALRPIHGYAIVQRIQQISGEALQIRQGSLYPALYRLENRGWLAAEWSTTEGGREAKFYRLTAEGRKQLSEETAGWKRLCDAIALVLESSD